MEMITLKAEGRAESGTRVSRALRTIGRMPAIMYGHGEPPESISLSFRDVESALAHGVRTFQVELGGSARQYLIKAVQYDHLGDKPIHLDLTRVSMDERVKVRVGIELRGVPKGVADGGILDQHMADLEIECLVIEIPDTIHPLVTELGLGDSLLVKELELPAGVVVLANPEDRVATVRALIEEAVPEDAEATEEKEEEPERIGRVHKEEEDKKGK